MGLNLDRLKEQQIKIEASRRAILAKIKKAKVVESKERFEKAGKELFEFFRTDSTCADSQKLASICLKYFSPPEISESGLPKESKVSSGIAAEQKKPSVPKAN